MAVDIVLGRTEAGKASAVVGVIQRPASFLAGGGDLLYTEATGRGAPPVR